MKKINQNNKFEKLLIFLHRKSMSILLHFGKKTFAWRTDRACERKLMTSIYVFNLRISYLRPAFVANHFRFWFHFGPPPDIYHFIFDFSEHFLFNFIRSATRKPTNRTHLRLSRLCYAKPTMCELLIEGEERKKNEEKIICLHLTKENVLTSIEIILNK